MLVVSDPDAMGISTVEPNDKWFESGKNVVPVPNNSRHSIYSILRSLFSGKCDSSLHQHRHDGTDRRKCGKKHSVDSSNSLLLLFGVNMHSGNGLHLLSVVTITLAHTKFCEYFSVSFEKNE